MTTKWMFQEFWGGSIFQTGMGRTAPVLPLEGKDKESSAMETSPSTATEASEAKSIPVVSEHIVSTPDTCGGAASRQEPDSREGCRHLACAPKHESR